MIPSIRDMFRMFIIVLICLGHHVAIAAFLPLPPAVRCAHGNECTVINYQGIWADRKPCRASKALFPTSEQELVEAVALAVNMGTKVKVVGSSHSFSKLVCPGGDNGLLVSTQRLTSVIHVNVSSRTVAVDAGVKLPELISTAAKFGLTLPHLPVWQGVTVAGVISTGAHGSGQWGRGSQPSNYVVGVRLVVPAEEEEGFAKVINLKEGDEDLKAAKLSLGVLGAISQVTFRLEPMFKRSARLEIADETVLNDDGIPRFGRQHEFGEIYWYPFSAKVMLKVEDRVDVETEGDGAYRNAILDRLNVSHIENMRHGLEIAEETENLDALCEDEFKIMNFRQSSGDGLVNDGQIFTGYPVIGFNHKMQTSGGCEIGDVLPTITATRIETTPELKESYIEDELLVTPDLSVASRSAEMTRLETCVWNSNINGFFYFDTAIAVPMSRAAEAFSELKRLRDLKPEAMCSFAYIGGIWLRFLAGSDAYLATGTESLVFEFMYYRSRQASTPRLHEDLFEEMEQMLLQKFGGRPHWGKNRNLAFRDMESRVANLEKFLEARHRFDPRGFFSSEWSDAILSVKRNAQTLQDHCALEGLCICEDDSHCHPEKGYFCRPGLAYTEARVCRKEKSDPST
ncbi:hypothetical protein KP509_31G007000 [Ceratopteris richardii]|uniref:FAD-binding PCMH-type domain-containing protein n=1 Tax=Ceratopteris richardii TaxID=49495 RepID=A0A8T2QVE2_CERRI|nr:hypothetical protein KP509_31G007000 [Ceratopteris richardii]